VPFLSISRCRKNRQPRNVSHSGPFWFFVCFQINTITVLVLAGDNDFMLLSNEKGPKLITAGGVSNLASRPVVGDDDDDDDDDKKNV